VLTTFGQEWQHCIHGIVDGHKLTDTMLHGNFHQLVFLFLLEDILVIAEKDETIPPFPILTFLLTLGRLFIDSSTARVDVIVVVVFVFFIIIVIIIIAFQMATIRGVNGILEKLHFRGRAFLVEIGVVW
jgi:hypothetical protein